MEWWELGHFTSDLLTITETFEELAEEEDRKSVSFSKVYCRTCCKYDVGFDRKQEDKLQGNYALV